MNIKNKDFYLTIILILSVFSAFSQKRAIQVNDLKNWPTISNQEISNDGKFAAYTVNTPNAGNTLYIKAINNNWQKAIPIKEGDYFFSPDSRFLIFRQEKDSLGIMDLRENRTRYLLHVKSYAIPNKGTLLAFRSTDSTKGLVIYNLANEEQKEFGPINDYHFCGDGENLIIQTFEDQNGQPKDKMTWLNLKNNVAHVISTDDKIYPVSFDDSETQLAFISELNSTHEKSLKYYRLGMDTSSTVVNNFSLGMEGMQVSKNGGFFKDGVNGIFFFMTSKNMADSVKKNEHMASVDIWNYKDKHFHTPQYQLEEGKSDDFGIASFVQLNHAHKIIRLREPGDYNTYGNIIGNDRYELSVKYLENKKAGTLNLRDSKYAFQDVYLVSLKDGSRKKMINYLPYYDNLFYLTSKYLIYYNCDQKQWISYNINSSKQTILIKSNATSRLYRDNNGTGGVPDAIGLAGVFKNGNEALIYDHYDIWKVYLDNHRPPINITESLGQKNHVILRLLQYSGGPPIPVFSEHDTLILEAFNERTKFNGYYKKVLNKPHSLELLTMDNCLYVTDFINNAGADLYRAKKTNSYILIKMTPNQYPNIYSTTDFKAFKQITHLEPQNAVNWYTTELIHYPLSDGRLAEGILYKPKDFDTNKKYPIIYYYYETCDYNLNLFLEPELMSCTLNIPWYTSRGYLVFRPSIHYKMDYAGQNACDYVVSAANYLGQRSWVNKKRMGLQGHSWGGYETNYIVAHSHLFAAALSASGISELISFSSIHRFHTTNEDWFTEGQFRIHLPFWQSPSLYIRNSPLYNAKNVTTPLLLMHNQDDDNHPFQQDVEWYATLERLGKKVWMLQYDHEGHVLNNEVDQIDYTVRTQQFFDHYLKGARAPKWMTVGIPAKMKQVDDGLEIDDSVKH